MQKLIRAEKVLPKLKSQGCIHYGHLLLNEKLTFIANKAYLTEDQFKECQDKDNQVSGGIGQIDGQQALTA